MNYSKIRTLRHERKITQQELAENVKIDRAFLALIELGKRNPSLKTVKRIADYFNVKIDDLIKEDD